MTLNNPPFVIRVLKTLAEAIGVAFMWNAVIGVKALNAATNSEGNQMGICIATSLSGPVPCGTPIALAEQTRINADGSITTPAGIESRSVADDETQIRICQTIVTDKREENGAITRVSSTQQCGNYPRVLFQKPANSPVTPISALILPDPADQTSFGTNGTLIAQSRLRSS